MTRCFSLLCFYKVLYLWSAILFLIVAAAINNLTFYRKESAVLRRSQLAIARCKSNTSKKMKTKGKKNNHCCFFFYLFRHSSDAEVGAQLQHGRHAGGHARLRELVAVQRCAGLYNAEQRFMINTLTNTVVP